MYVCLYVCAPVERAKAVVSNLSAAWGLIGSRNEASALLMDRGNATQRHTTPLDSSFELYGLAYLTQRERERERKKRKQASDHRLEWHDYHYYCIPKYVMYEYIHSFIHSFIRSGRPALSIGVSPQGRYEHAGPNGRWARRVCNCVSIYLSIYPSIHPSIHWHTTM